MPHAKKVDVPLDDRLGFSVAEIAGTLGLAQSTIHKLLASGRLKSVKVAGRRIIPRQALDELLAESDR